MDVVGNDVVYLADPDISGHHLRDRFVERVCGVDECMRVRGSEDPHLLLWSMFAAKEAAYKAVFKLRARIAFAPRLFEVNPELTRVSYRDIDLRLRVACDTTWVHAVVCSAAATAVDGIARRPPGMNQSDAVRAFACRELAARFRLPGDRLTIERPADPGARDGLAPPRLRQDGRPLSIDISLSHDGPYVAFAALRQGVEPPSNR